MGHNWSHGVLEHSKATLGSRLVLAVLAESADVDTGTCYPSLATIARRAGLSERQTRRCLRTLEDLGDIQTLPQASAYDTNIYQINRSLLGGDNLSGGTFLTQNVSKMSPKPSVKPSTNKNTRMKENWTPSPAGISFAQEKGLLSADIERESENFRDHWLSKAEARADWDASWRTWVRNSLRFNQTSRTTAKRPTSGMPVFKDNQ